MKRKIALAVCCTLLAGVLTGCWSRRELNEIAIILGAGIDMTEKGLVRLTVQVAIPPAFMAGAGEQSKGGQQEPASMEVSADGTTVEEAQRFLAMKIPRDLYWGHCMVLILGEEMAKKGIRLVTDFFERDSEPRENMWVMVVKGKAEDFLHSSSILEKTSSQAVSLLTRMRTGLSVRLTEFSEMLAEDGIQPAVTAAKIVEENALEESQQQAGAKKRAVEISGAALFKEDRLVGWMDPDETRGLLLLKNRPVVGVISFPTPDEPDKMVSVRMKRSSTKVYLERPDEVPHFKVKIRVEGDMVEQQSREDLAEPEKIAKLEDMMAGEVKDMVEMALHKAQNVYGVDVFGFGQVYHRRFKDEWKNIKDNWDDVFRQAEVAIEVEARITEIGLFSKRPGTKK